MYTLVKHKITRQRVDREVNSSLVKSLDPLAFDQFTELIPTLNASKDAKTLVQLTYQCIPVPDFIKSMNFEQAIASMRDVGILLGSLKRHGVEPVKAVPELEYVLEELSIKTDLPPRDTLFHYTIWNPDGDRMRTYTKLPDELALIKSVKSSFYPLMEAIYGLIDLHKYSIESKEFALLCEKTENKFKGMVESIVYAKRNVSPEVFADELRFYYDPIFLHKAFYIGPGAVELPVFVYDHLLWSSDIEDETYTKFKSTYLPFNVASTRDIYYNYISKPSLTSKAFDYVTKTSTYSKTGLESLKALHKLCSTMKSFRMPHKKMAKEAYNHQQRQAKRNKGSGGYSPEILSYILELNLKQIIKLEKMIKFYQKKLTNR